MLVGTAMMIARGRRSVAENDFGARIGRIIGSFAFFAVHVTNVVGILFGKLVARDIGKVTLEKQHSLVHVQARALEKETILQASPVLQVLVLFETRVQLCLLYTSPSPRDRG